MSLYKIYGTGVTDALATVDIVANGRIRTIQWAARGTLNADAETFDAELSFASASGFTSNDTKSSISTVRAQAGILTSGGLNASVNLTVVGLDIPVSVGERLYLHAAGTSFTGTVYIHVDDKASQVRRVRQ